MRRLSCCNLRLSFISVWLDKKLWWCLLWRWCSDFESILSIRTDRWRFLCFSVRLVWVRRSLLKFWWVICLILILFWCVLIWVNIWRSILLCVWLVFFWVTWVTTRAVCWRMRFVKNRIRSCCLMKLKRCMWMFLMFCCNFWMRVMLLICKVVMCFFVIVWLLWFLIWVRMRFFTLISVVIRWMLRMWLCSMFVCIFVLNLLIVLMSLLFLSCWCMFKLKRLCSCKWRSCRSVSIFSVWIFRWIEALSSIWRDKDMIWCMVCVWCVGWFNENLFSFWLMWCCEVCLMKMI